MLNLPVLLYNKLDPVLYDDLTYRMDQFSEQINHLKINNYQSVSCKEIIDYFNRNVQLPEKPVLITFDGGYMANFEFARQVLKQSGIKATFFIAGEWALRSTCEEPGYVTEHMNLIQLRQLCDEGFELAIHGYTQVHFNMSMDAIKVDIEKNIAFLKKFDLPFTKALAYSLRLKFGQFAKRRQWFDLLRQLKIELGFREGNKLNNLQSMNVLDIRRIKIGRYDTSKEFVRKLRRGY